MNNFEAHTAEERLEMLNSIELNSVEDLYSDLPKDIRIDNLNLGLCHSEMDVTREIKKLAATKYDLCLMFHPFFGAKKRIFGRVKPGERVRSGRQRSIVHDSNER